MVRSGQQSSPEPALTSKVCTVTVVVRLSQVTSAPFRTGGGKMQVESGASGWARDHDRGSHTPHQVSLATFWGDRHRLPCPLEWEGTPLGLWESPSLPVSHWYLTTVFALLQGGVVEGWHRNTRATNCPIHVKMTVLTIYTCAQRFLIHSFSFR